jgi:hypothetical protein
VTIRAPGGLVGVFDGASNYSLTHRERVSTSTYLAVDILWQTAEK